MAQKDDDPTIFQTSSEESQRQAEAAFGGGGSAPPIGGTAQPVGVPGSDDRRLRLVRGLLIAVIALGLLAATGVGVYLLVQAGGDDDKPDKPSFTLPAIPGVPSLPEVPSAPEPSPPEEPSEPSAPSDYFSTAGLRAAKAKARDLAGARARIQLARVAQDQLQVIARTESRGKVVIVSTAVTRAIDTPSGGLTGDEFGFESFNPAVAGRLTRAIDRRYDISPGAINYMVVIRDPIDKKIEWLVYPRSGASHFQADSRGGSLRRVG
jgi:hypothetical protein